MIFADLQIGDTWKFINQTTNHIFIKVSDKKYKSSIKDRNGNIIVFDISKLIWEVELLIPADGASRGNRNA